MSARIPPSNILMVGSMSSSGRTRRESITSPNEDITTIDVVDGIRRNKVIRSNNEVDGASQSKAKHTMKSRWWKVKTMMGLATKKLTTGMFEGCLDPSDFPRILDQWLKLCGLNKIPIVDMQKVADEFDKRSKQALTKEVKAKLNLSNCHLRDEHLQLLCRVLASNPKIVSLDISNNPAISSTGMYSLCQLMFCQVDASRQLAGENCLSRSIMLEEVIWEPISLTFPANSSALLDNICDTQPSALLEEMISKASAELKTVNVKNWTRRLYDKYGMPESLDDESCFKIFQKIVNKGRQDYQRHCSTTSSSSSTSIIEELQSIVLAGLVQDGVLPPPLPDNNADDSTPLLRESDVAEKSVGNDFNDKHEAFPAHSYDDHDHDEDDVDDSLFRTSQIVDNNNTKEHEDHDLWSKHKDEQREEEDHQEEEIASPRRASVPAVSVRRSSNAHYPPVANSLRSLPAIPEPKEIPSAVDSSDDDMKPSNQVETETLLPAHDLSEKVINKDKGKFDSSKTVQVTEANEHIKVPPPMSSPAVMDPTSRFTATSTALRNAINPPSNEQNSENISDNEIDVSADESQGVDNRNIVNPSVVSAANESDTKKENVAVKNTEDHYLRLLADYRKSKQAVYRYVPDDVDEEKSIPIVSDLHEVVEEKEVMVDDEKSNPVVASLHDSDERAIVADDSYDDDYGWGYKEPSTVLFDSPDQKGIENTQNNKPHDTTIDQYMTSPGYYDKYEQVMKELSQALVKRNLPVDERLPEAQINCPPSTTAVSTPSSLGESISPAVVSTSKPSVSSSPSSPFLDQSVGWLARESSAEESEVNHLEEEEDEDDDLYLQSEVSSLTSISSFSRAGNSFAGHMPCNWVSAKNNTNSVVQVQQKGVNEQEEEEEEDAIFQHLHTTTMSSAQPSSASHSRRPSFDPIIEIEPQDEMADDMITPIKECSHPQEKVLFSPSSSGGHTLFSPFSPQLNLSYGDAYPDVLDRMDAEVFNEDIVTEVLQEMRSSRAPTPRQSFSLPPPSSSLPPSITTPAVVAVGSTAASIDSKEEVESLDQSQHSINGYVVGVSTAVSPIRQTMTHAAAVLEAFFLKQQEDDDPSDDAFTSVSNFDTFQSNKNWRIDLQKSVITSSEPSATSSDPTIEESRQYYEAVTHLADETLERSQQRMQDMVEARGNNNSNSSQISSVAGCILWHSPDSCAAAAHAFLDRLHSSSTSEDHHHHHHFQQQQQQQHFHILSTDRLSEESFDPTQSSRSREIMLDDDDMILDKNNNNNDDNNNMEAIPMNPSSPTIINRTVFDCSGRCKTERDFSSAIFQPISVARLLQITTLLLSYNTITSLSRLQLKERFPHLTCLDLSHNHLSGPVISSILPRKLKKLDLSYNEITLLTDSHQSLPSLEDINLSHNKIFYLEMFPLSLKRLDVSYNGITTVAVFRILALNHRLEKIMIHGNSLPSSRYNAQAVKRLIPSLKYLPELLPTSTPVATAATAAVAAGGGGPVITSTGRVKDMTHPHVTPKIDSVRTMSTTTKQPSRPSEHNGLVSKSTTKALPSSAIHSKIRQQQHQQQHGKNQSIVSTTTKRSQPVVPNAIRTSSYQPTTTTIAAAGLPKDRKYSILPLQSHRKEMKDAVVTISHQHVVDNSNNNKYDNDSHANNDDEEMVLHTSYNRYEDLIEAAKESICNESRSEMDDNSSVIAYDILQGNYHFNSHLDDKKEHNETLTLQDDDGNDEEWKIDCINRIMRCKILLQEIVDLANIQSSISMNTLRSMEEEWQELGFCDHQQTFIPLQWPSYIQQLHYLRDRKEWEAKMMTSAEDDQTEEEELVTMTFQLQDFHQLFQQIHTVMKLCSHSSAGEGKFRSMLRRLMQKGVGLAINEQQHYIYEVRQD